MSLSKDDILNAIAEMSLMDVVELVEAMEEKFGVSVAEAVAAAPAARARTITIAATSVTAFAKNSPYSYKNSTNASGVIVCLIFLAESYQ